MEASVQCDNSHSFGFAWLWNNRVIANWASRGKFSVSYKRAVNCVRNIAESLTCGSHQCNVFGWKRPRWREFRRDISGTPRRWSKWDDKAFQWRARFDPRLASHRHSTSQGCSGKNKTNKQVSRRERTEHYSKVTNQVALLTEWVAVHGIEWLSAKFLVCQVVIIINTWIYNSHWSHLRQSKQVKHWMW